MLTREKVFHWSQSLLRRYWPDAHVVEVSNNELRFECGHHEGNVFHNPGECALGLVCSHLNNLSQKKNSTIRFKEFGYDYGGYVPAGVTIEWTDPWADNKMPENFFDILRATVQGRAPYDEILGYRLKNMHKSVVQEMLYPWRDDPIEGCGYECVDHHINFKVEAIVEDPLAHEVVPIIWTAFGRVCDYDFDILASSPALAISKALKTVYKYAKSNNKELARSMETSNMAWRTYGYCR